MIGTHSATWRRRKCELSHLPEIPALHQGVIAERLCRRPMMMAQRKFEFRDCERIECMVGTIRIT